VKVKNETPEYIFWSGSTTPEDAPSYFQKLYRKVFKAAGVEGSSHDFRHTFAIEQAETRRRYTNGEQGAGAFVSNSD
jgi:integrase